MFIGREKELRLLGKYLGPGAQNAALVYGRRRVGKSSLIMRAIEKSERKAIYFTAVPDELAVNARRLSRLVTATVGLPPLSIDDFEEVLALINSLKEEIVLVIDEYQDLRKKTKGEVVDAYMRDFVDRNPDNLRVIISGSAIRTMKSLLEKENPLFGRFTECTIALGDLDYREASLFYSERTTREKISLYAVFGGLPMILAQIDPALSVEENIISLLIDKNGAARVYVEDVLIDEIASSGSSYSVLARLARGKRTYNGIKASLSDESSRNSLDYNLKQLVKAEFIDKKQPINSEDEKKTFYEIKINMLRFYLAYIEARAASGAMARGLFEAYVRPSLDTFISYRFEDMVRVWFEHLAQSGKRNDILRVGSYWYNDPKRKMNGEFCVALQTAKGYEIYEVKFLKDPMKESLVKKELDDISTIPAMNVVATGFVSSSGFEREGENRYSGDDIYL